MTDLLRRAEYCLCVMPASALHRILYKASLVMVPWPMGSNARKACLRGRNLLACSFIPMSSISFSPVAMWDAYKV